MNDHQLLVAIILSCAGFLTGFVFNMFQKRLSKLEDEMNSLQQKLPQVYATKQEVKERSAEILNHLNSIISILTKDPQCPSEGPEKK